MGDTGATNAYVLVGAPATTAQVQQTNPAMAGAGGYSAFAARHQPKAAAQAKQLMHEVSGSTGKFAPENTSDSSRPQGVPGGLRLLIPAEAKGNVIGTAGKNVRWVCDQNNI